jgi:protein regulator of cytokinesis 1
MTVAFSEIFELAKERQELWDKMLALEDRANDPNRLFLNRGGQLLLEEKERKNIQKVIL